MYGGFIATVGPIGNTSKYQKRAYYGYRNQRIKQNKLVGFVLDRSQK